MRTIHVVKNPDKAAVLGSHRHVLDLAAAQRASGYEVAVVTDGPGLFTEICDQQGLPVIITGNMGMLGMAGPEDEPRLHEMQAKFMRVRDGLIDRFRDFRADVIHCHDEMSAYLAIAAGNEAGIPCVLTFHAPPGPVSSLMRTRYKCAVITTSKALFNVLGSQLPREVLYFVPYATKTVPEVCREGASGKNPNLIMMSPVGILNGTDMAVLALVGLRQRHGSRCPQLNVYNGGEGTEFYTEMAAVLGLQDMISFHEPRLDILDSCNRSDIVLELSPGGADSLVVLEAMSRGMPVICADVRDNAELLPDQRYGRVVRRDSVPALAEAIDATLSDIADGRFSPSALIERHRALYSMERMIECIDSVYRETLARALSGSLRHRIRKPQTP